MKQILYCILLVSFFAVSCKKDITDLNIDPKQPSLVPSSTLFTNASINLSDEVASTNVNTNNFRLFSQYWAETSYPDETDYNLDGRQITDRWFAAFYTDVLQDLNTASTLLDAEQKSVPAPNTDAVYKNKKAEIEILNVFSYYHLVTSFGNIPYTDAFNIENTTPKYDDAATVYSDLIKRLDAALAELNIAEGGFGNADIILKGDMNAWKIFGNSLKMRMGLVIADVDPSTASTMILAAAPNVVSNNGENLKMNYLSSPPNTNPVWEDLVQSGRNDYVGTSVFIDTLLKLNDPRLPLFFEPITNGSYKGGVYGLANSFANFSLPSNTISEPTFPHTFFSYAEMEFYKAEAVERGIAVGGTAEEHYNNAIDASIEEWGGTAAQALTYRSQPSVAYSIAPGDFKNKIGVQSWIALYDRGYDSWTQWRRLDYPRLKAPDDGIFKDGETAGVIVRLTYPVQEQNLNKENYNAASSAVGKDQITQKLWFDKF